MWKGTEYPRSAYLVPGSLDLDKLALYSCFYIPDSNSHKESLPGTHSQKSEELDDPSPPGLSCGDVKRGWGK